ncbi:MAG: hypothetical protein HOC91_15290 [Nitrospinaceae bacterium]|nr:hypothetical protein [Nitrospinaceae bacterium]MBT4431874.1 hypothetical protein [Nitrospinaceae bacterium]MBT5366971.1 hypothetical protein [Nitrospinaceae bacterium]MBT6393265.1 hypothetical protein [Nitrospinaceae bacterium]
MRFYAVVVLLLVLAGCAYKGSDAPVRLPLAAEIDTHLRSRKFPSSSRSLVFVEVDSTSEESSFSPLQDLMGGEGDTYAGKAVLLWKQPASLRMEFLSPFGAPMFVIVAAKGELRAFSVARGRYYEGRANSETMAKWLGLPITPSLMIRILQGALPYLGGEVGAARVGRDEEGGAVRLELPPGAGLDRRQVAHLGRKNFMPDRVLLGERGAELEIRYGDFRRTGKYVRPLWVELRDSRRGRRVRIHLNDENPSLGETLPDDLFQLEIPVGALVAPLSKGRGR